jgi:hypothetical protein
MGVLLDIRYRFGFMSARAQRSALFQYHSLARARAEFKRNFAAMRARAVRGLALNSLLII